MGRAKRSSREREAERSAAPSGGAGGSARRGIWNWILGAVVIAIVILLTARPWDSTPGSGSSSGDRIDVPDPDTTDMEAAVATAIGKARRAVLKQPLSGGAWGHLAAVLDAHSIHAPAELCYRRAANLDPQDPRYTYNRAVVLESLGADPDEILPLLQRFAGLHPDFPPVHFRIGVVQARAGRLEPACAAYRRALQLDPDLAIARRCLGQALLALDENADALSQLGHAAELAPLDGPTQAGLSQAHLRLGNEERAAEAAARARSLGPILDVPDPVRFQVVKLGVSSSLASARARVHAAEGDFASAVEALQIVANIRPGDPRVHERLAEAYRGLGSRELAEEHGRRARELHAGR